MPMRHICLLFIALVFAAQTLAAQPQVSARFEPEELAVGERGQYVITVGGDNAQDGDAFSLPRGGAQPELPDGLTMLDQQSSRRLNIVNGKVSYQRSYRLVFRAERPGEYSLPSFEVELGGKPYAVPAATVKVVEARSETPGATLPGKPRLELKLKRERLYVGEAMPAEVRFRLSADTQVLRSERTPGGEGEAFSIAEMRREDIRQREVRGAGGERLVEVAFPTVMVPLKAGEQTLRFDYRLTIAGEDPFAGLQRGMNPFFRSLRFGQPELLDLSTGELKLEVLPLPEEGKPESFAGAIGELEAVQEIEESKGLRVGEPVSVKLEVSGYGNFPRMGAPLVAESDDWKVFPPRESFVQEDNYGYRGTKTFEYIFVPRKSGHLNLPTLRFSYFDPEAETYREQTMPPIALDVAPAPAGATPPEPSQVLSQSEAPTSESSASSPFPDNGLVGLHLQAGSERSLRPVFTQSWFWVVNGLLALAAVPLWWVLKRRYRLRTQPDYALRVRLSKQMRVALREAHARQRKDVSAFLAAAERALQLAVARACGREPTGMTRMDVEHYLHSLELEPVLLGAAVSLLNAHETAKYARTSQKTVDPTLLLRQLETLIRELP